MRWSRVCRWRVRVQEREELLAKNAKEMDGLFEKRRNLERKFVEEKMSKEEQYQSEVRHRPSWFVSLVARLPLCSVVSAGVCLVFW